MMLKVRLNALKHDIFLWTLYILVTTLKKLLLNLFLSHYLFTAIICVGVLGNTSINFLFKYFSKICELFQILASSLVAVANDF